MTFATFCIVLTYIFPFFFKECTKKLWPTHTELLCCKALCVATILLNFV